MKPDIVFDFDGTVYRVAYEACDLNLIILPDGRAVKASAWLESYPPQPEQLEEVPHLFTSFKPEEIAVQMNGVLATEVVETTDPA